MHILLAESQPKVRSALRVLLEHQPEIHVVDEVSTTNELFEQLKMVCPNIVLLDWELPGLVEAGSIPSLRQLCPMVIIIVLGVWLGTEQEALVSGADAYSSKIEPPERLLTIIKKFL